MVIEKFLRYIAVDTQSSETSGAHPSAEKQKGLGRMLIDAVWSRMKERGAAGMWLCTHQANLRGQMLYYNYGFEHMGNHTSGEMLFLYRRK